MYSTLTIFITTVTLNGTTIGDKLVETLYSNRVKGRGWGRKSFNFPF